MAQKIAEDSGLSFFLSHWHWFLVSQRWSLALAPGSLGFAFDVSGSLSLSHFSVWSICTHCRSSALGATLA